MRIALTVANARVVLVGRIAKLMIFVTDLLWRLLRAQMAGPVVAGSAHVDVRLTCVTLDQPAQEKITARCRTARAVCHMPAQVIQLVKI